MNRLFNLLIIAVSLVSILFSSMAISNAKKAKELLKEEWICKEVDGAFIEYGARECLYEICHIKNDPFSERIRIKDIDCIGYLKDREEE